MVSRPSWAQWPIGRSRLVVGDEQMRFRYGLERMRGGGQIREHQAGEREAKHDESGNTV